MSWLFCLLPCCPSAARALLFEKGVCACDNSEMDNILRSLSIVSKMPLLAKLNGIASFGNAKICAEIL